MTVAKKEDFTPSALLVDDVVLLVNFGDAGMSTIFLLWIYKNCMIFHRKLHLLFTFNVSTSFVGKSPFMPTKMVFT